MESSQGKVTVDILDENYLVNACHIMQKSLVQYQRPLLSEEAELVRSSKWMKFAGQLTSDYPCVLNIVVAQTGQQLFIAGTDNIMHVVIEEVVWFITQNTIYRLSCHFFPSRQIFVANRWQDTEVCILNGLQAACEVEVSLEESGQEFHIRGTQRGLNTMIKRLKLLGSYVKCHKETITDQVKIRFLSLSNCVRDLEERGRSIRCVFSLEEEPASLVLEHIENSRRVVDDEAFNPMAAVRQNPKCSPMSRNETCRSRRDAFNLPMAKETQLYVYSESERGIRRALSHFDDLVREKFAHNEIVHSVIQNMTKDELQSVRDVGETYNVVVQIVVGSIIVDGLFADVVNACEKISGIINEAVGYRYMTKQAAIRGCISHYTVQWCYLEKTRKGTEEVKYSKYHNLIIEFAYKENERTAMITDVYGVQYIVDFVSMKEYPACDPQDTADVIRRNKMRDYCYI